MVKKENAREQCESEYLIVVGDPSPRFPPQGFPWFPNACWNTFQEMSRSKKSKRRLGLILQVHATSQIVSAVLAAAAMSINNFDNSFNNCHQWIGVVVYGLNWLQALIGFLRPQRGCKERRLWFSLHWTLGTALTLLGVIDMYTGLLAYRDKASRSVKLWLILFTVEISSVAVVCLFQDKWP